MGEMLAALDFDGNPLNVEYDRMGRKTALESADMGRKEQLLSRRLLAASRDDPERRWLARIATTNADGFWVYQDIKYDINAVGNVTGYKNDNHFFKTTQEYNYDDLYQLTDAHGVSTGYINRSKSGTSYNSDYRQTFTFDAIGNMKWKESSSFGTLGANLNYNFVYTRAEGSPHRMARTGDMYYRY
ncbi:MAG: hypothetical protein LBB82_05530, partial [Treponema sp.]|nr:hypothetical protein [Treponema sp.]